MRGFRDSVQLDQGEFYEELTRLGRKEEDTYRQAQPFPQLWDIPSEEIYLRCWHVEQKAQSKQLLYSNLSQSRNCSYSKVYNWSSIIHSEIYILWNHQNDIWDSTLVWQNSLLTRHKRDPKYTERKENEKQTATAPHRAMTSLTMKKIAPATTTSTMRRPRPKAPTKQHQDPQKLQQRQWQRKQKQEDKSNKGTTIMTTIETNTRTSTTARHEKQEQ